MYRVVSVLNLYFQCQPFQIISTMSGRGKGGKVKGKAKSRSSRASLQFPVGRSQRWVTAFFVQGYFLYNWSCSGRETVTSVWALELRSTCPLSWRISPPGSPSWLATLPTLPGTIRIRGYFPGTCSQLSGTGVARSILALTLLIAQER